LLFAEIAGEGVHVFVFRRAVAADPLGGMSLGVRQDDTSDLLFGSTFLVEVSASSAFFKVVVLTSSVRRDMCIPEQLLARVASVFGFEHRV